MNSPAPRRRRLFSQPLKEVVHRITAPVMDARHKTLALFIRDWEEIVGAEMARHTVPLRIVFPHTQASGGTLHIQLPAYLAPELPYMTPQLLEKITSYLGHAAIARIVPEIKG
jgi:hypothetical protein